MTLAIISLLAILLFLFQDEVKQPRASRFLRSLFVFLLLGSQIGYQIWMVATDRWSVRTSLPLQLSDLSVYLSAIMLVTKSRKLFVFLFFVGIGSSIQALATPDLGMFSFPHIRYILFFISHGSVFLSCLLMAVIGTYRMGQRSLWVTVLLVNVYGVCIFLIDRWLGANYMYLTKKPGGSSLLDVLGPWRGISSRLKPSQSQAFSFFIGFIASSKNDTFFVVSHILFKKMSENVFIFLKKGM